MMPAAQSIVERAKALAAEIATLPVPEQVEALNAIAELMAAAGPFADQPIANVQWVPAAQVKPNDYGPGVLDSGKRALLRKSLHDDGLLAPLATVRTGSRSEVTVDGSQRLVLAREKAAAKRLSGYVPVVRVRPGREAPEDLRATTHRVNAARGTLAFDREAAVFRAVSAKWDLATISAQFGYSAEYTIRLQQVSKGKGILDLYADRGFGRAHTMVDE